jgi:DMSO/TMAO reductase YedYZ molybdopterin-dependent catalytic subunit
MCPCHRPQDTGAAQSVPTQLSRLAAPAAVPVATPSPQPIATAEPLWGVATPVHITPNDEFYSLAISQRDDFFSQEPYHLEVSGAVARGVSLTMAEIRSFPSVEQMRTLECIGNPVGGSMIGNAMWRGLRLADLLRQAGPVSTAIEVKLVGADGFSTSLPIALAMHPDSLLVYDMNGVPLPNKHGAPLRALFPGRYGMKQPKWVTTIELITEPYLGTYERVGWTNDAIVRPNTQIRTPTEGEIVATAQSALSGTSFANEAGIRSVEVSLDSGQTWLPARLVGGPTSLAWTEWRVQWMAPQAGPYTVLARATDGDGIQQPLARERSAQPDATFDAEWTVDRASFTVRR